MITISTVSTTDIVRTVMRDLLVARGLILSAQLMHVMQETNYINIINQNDVFNDKDKLTAGADKEIKINKYIATAVRIPTDQSVIFAPLFTDQSCPYNR